MAMEIEHKFLLANEQWRPHVRRSCWYRQGYLSGNPLSSVRVRVAGDRAWLNIKSATIGNRRHEFEYEIPLTDAETLLNELCLKPLIEKTRHFVDHGGHVWEIDEFSGDNLGLIVAEIELSEVDEAFEKPVWLGEEVTYDVRYYNNNLSRQPYKSW
ncbi:MAG: CYTH domain-containing protein [Methylomonas sp.]|nr:CYTH domain-containing protein [Methylomonas sp.]PPD20552.1 MAG: CYTH domain protein [Methylomonas sp.]PPD26566.1 MAG: CYTH domain protein [Methylomonas sp.]PPD38361.1 MAG: CYTH domain protein [Methylomonas sp.]PPD42847.1 MAG: CYTH domain protein [Methylomonas sp.]